MADKRIYTIKLNTNGEIKVPTIRLFNTDENVFSLKVFIEEGTNTGKILLSAVELADYELKLKIIKPKSNQYREVDGVLDPVDGYFLFRMPKNCYDVPGTYKAQLFFSNTLKTSDTTDDEVISSKIFSYVVDASIVTQLNQQIEADPNKDVLLDLIDRVKELNKQVSSDNLTPDEKAALERLGTGTLTTSAKNLIDGVNELDKELGDLKTLKTTAKGDLVRSVNEVVDNVDSLEGDLIIAKDDLTKKIDTVDGKLVDYVKKELGKSLVLDTEIAKIHEHSNKATLDGVTDIKVKDWDEAYDHSQEPHAPANAQKNSDITKAEIEAKLTGVVNSHIHDLGEYVKKSELGLQTINVITRAKTLEGSINELANDKVTITDIVDDLTTADVFKPLSANQGKVLKDDLGDKASLTTTAKENVVEAINELDAEIGDISTLNTTEKTDIVAAINELQEMQPEVARKDLENKAAEVTLDATPTQNIVIDEDIEITLPTDLSFRKIRLNLVNSKTPNYIASTSTTPGALVVVDNDVLVSGQIRLSDANKYGGTFIVGNYVEFVTGEIMATFKQGDVVKKFKVGADSLNEFEMLLNEGKSVIRKFSDVAVELTTEEEQKGIMK